MSIKVLGLENFNHNIQQRPSKKIPNIDNLPPEVFENIFSNLNQLDMQNSACVSKKMQTKVTTVASFSARISIKNFIHFLIEGLNRQEKFSKQKRTLEDISKEALQEICNLSKLKENILDVKAKLINSIKTLDEKTINALFEHVQLPKFMENIFELSTIENAIDNASHMLDGREKWFAFATISYNLTKLEYFDRAIQIAELITDETLRNNTLMDISMKLAHLEKFEKATDIALLLSNKNERKIAFKYISIRLINQRVLDSIGYVANLIPDKDERDSALCEIFHSFLKLVSFNKAINFATSLPNKGTRTSVFQSGFGPLANVKKA